VAMASMSPSRLPHHAFYNEVGNLFSTNEKITIFVPDGRNQTIGTKQKSSRYYGKRL